MKTLPAPSAADLLSLVEDGSAALALVGADGLLRWANTRFAALFAASTGAGWVGLLRAQGVAERRRHAPERRFAATLSSGAWVLIHEARRADGVLVVTVTDLAPLRAEPEVLIAPEGQPDRAAALTALSRAMGNSDGWPLTVALWHSAAVPLGLRREEQGLCLAPGQHLLIFPSTVLGQVQLVLERLLLAQPAATCRPLQAQWGESAEDLLARLEARA